MGLDHFSILISKCKLRNNKSSFVTDVCAVTTFNSPKMPVLFNFSHPLYSKESQVFHFFATLPKIKLLQVYQTQQDIIKSKYLFKKGRL